VGAVHNAAIVVPVEVADNKLYDTESVPVVIVILCAALETPVAEERVPPDTEIAAVVATFE
jgi:hypothetical protein